MASCILAVPRPPVHVSNPVGTLVRLQVAARACNVSTSSVRRACNDGFIPVTVLSSGHRRVRIADCRAHFLGIQPEDTGRGDSAQENGKGIAVYARVSSDGQREYLTGQVERLVAYCGEHFAGQCPKVYSEVASGSNSDRIQLNRLIDAILQ